MTHLSASMFSLPFALKNNFGLMVVFYIGVENFLNMEHINTNKLKICIICCTIEDDLMCMSV